MSRRTSQVLVAMLAAAALAGCGSSADRPLRRDLADGLAIVRGEAALLRVGDVEVAGTIEGQAGRLGEAGSEEGG